MTDEAQNVPPEPPAAAAPRVGVPDMIRVMSDGSIGVDDERFIGIAIPHGTPFYSEAVVSDLRKRLAQAEAEAEGVKGEEVAGLDLKHALLSVPVVALLDLAEAALNRLSLRGFANACCDAGLTPQFALEKRGGSHD